MLLCLIKENELNQVYQTVMIRLSGPVNWAYGVLNFTAVRAHELRQTKQFH